jgi:ABC-type branched-subunit amino acid transport system substrate-binding protein
MKRPLVLALSLLVVGAMAISGCAPAATATSAPAAPPPTQAPAATEMPAPTAAPTEAPAKTVTIGFTSSQTGSLNVESTRQYNGLKLWMDQVNAAGGVKLADGSSIMFQAQTYDDESNKDRVQQLYTKLATEDNADFLISPYSSGLTAAAAVIAQQYNKVMITTGAADDNAYKQGYTLVYQAYTPASHYLAGALDLLAKTDPEAKTIAVAYSTDNFSTTVVTALKDYAESKGYEVPVFEGYDPATTDFSALINKIQAAAPDAVMGGGHFQDGSTFAKQFYEKQVGAKFFALLVAPPENVFAQLGDAAFGVIGPSQWEPEVKFTEAAAQSAGWDWFGPTGDDFTSAYKAAYNEDPTYHSAGGYAAGLILQKAIEDAGSTDTAAVAAALDQMTMLTFYGHIQFDTSAESHGLQIGHDMVYVQWQKDSSGNLVKQIVWPEAGATAPVVYPLP